MFAAPTRSLLGATKHLRLPVRSLSSSGRANLEQNVAPEPSPAADAPPAQVATSPIPEQTEIPAQPEQPELPVKEWYDRLGAFGKDTRLPRSVQAIYMRPLRRKAEHGLPVCDLQLRSYSVQNVEFFADFAIRAAYYLNLPVSGPVPLPRIVERWTVPRSNFVHKKSKENFERITLRRLIQIKDGNPDSVQAWLAFLRKHAFYGVGMKANVWEHDSLEGARGTEDVMNDVKVIVNPLLSGFGYRSQLRPAPEIPETEEKTEEKIEE